MGGGSSARVPGPPLILGRRHLEYVLGEFVEHYQEARPHQGLDQRTPSGRPAVTPLAAGRIVRQDRRGGLIHGMADRRRRAEAAVRSLTSDDRIESANG